MYYCHECVYHILLNHKLSVIGHKIFLGKEFKPYRRRKNLARSGIPSTLDPCVGFRHYHSGDIFTLTRIYLKGGRFFITSYPFYIIEAGIEILYR